MSTPPIEKQIDINRSPSPQKNLLPIIKSYNEEIEQLPNEDQIIRNRNSNSFIYQTFKIRERNSSRDTSKQNYELSKKKKTQRLTKKDKQLFQSYRLPIISKSPDETYKNKNDERGNFKKYLNFYENPSNQLELQILKNDRYEKKKLPNLSSEIQKPEKFRNEIEINQTEIFHRLEQSQKKFNDISEPENSIESCKLHQAKMNMTPNDIQKNPKEEFNLIAVKQLSLPIQDNNKNNQIKQFTIVNQDLVNKKSKYFARDGFYKNIKAQQNSKDLKNNGCLEKNIRMQNNKLSDMIIYNFNVSKKHTNDISERIIQQNKSEDRGYQKSPQSKQEKRIGNSILLKPKIFLKQPNHCYFYQIGPGNNGELVRRIMNERENWVESQIPSFYNNFRWQQNTYNYNFEKMTGDIGAPKELVNHFEFHREISTKSGLVKNISRYVSNPFEITPLTFIINMENSNDPEFQQFINFFVTNSPSEVSKSSISLPSAKIFYNYNKSNNLERNKSNKLIKLGSVFFEEKNYLWLLKPIDFNRGNGIHIFNKLDSLEILLNQYYNGFYSQSLDDENKEKEQSIENQQNEENSQVSPLNQKQIYKPIIFYRNGYYVKCRQFVIQKYIEKPLLINKRKFDIRMWCLLTHLHVGFVFKEGYLRTSSEEFSLQEEQIINPFIHLTNNAVQKYSKKYGQFESGNQMSFKAFQEYLDYHGLKFNFSNQCLPKIKQYMTIALGSVKNKIDKFHRKYCFEIFGFDFLIDETFNVWLIEVNTNPCIEESSPLLAQLIPRMLDDAYKMTIDILFPTSFKIPKQREVDYPKDFQINYWKQYKQKEQPNQNEQSKLNNKTEIIDKNEEINQCIELTNEKVQNKLNDYQTKQANDFMKLNEQKQNEPNKSIDQKKQNKHNFGYGCTQYHVEGYSCNESMWQYLGHF